MENNKQEIKKEAEKQHLTPVGMIAKLQQEVYKMKLVKNGIGRSAGGTFKYYTVEDTMHIVNTACQNTGITLHVEKIEFKLLENRWICILYIYLGQTGNPHSKIYTFQGFCDTQQRNLIQSTGSTITYLTRYSFMSLLGIADNAEDPDSKETIKNKKTVKVENIKPSKPKIVVNEAAKKEGLKQEQDMPEDSIVLDIENEKESDYE